MISKDTTKDILMEWNFDDDKPIDVSSDETEVDALIDSDDTISKSPPASPKSLQIRELANQDIPADLVALPGSHTDISSNVAKLKVLDAIPDNINTVSLCLDKFANAISSTSNRTISTGAPSAGPAVTPSTKGESINRHDEA
ncbi:hypothetical protein Tco_0329333 [Tanacetum coccineum]